MLDLLIMKKKFYL